MPSQLSGVLGLLVAEGPFLLGGVGLLAMLLMLERRGRRVTVLLVVLTTALADATIYPDTESSQAASLFHINLAGQSLRTTQVVILAALGARIAVNGLPRTRHRSGPLWMAFFAWIVVSAVVGVVGGHNTSFVSRQAMILIQVGGAMLLAADTPAEQLTRDAVVPRFFRWTAVAAATLAVADTLGVRITTHAIPLLPLNGFGALGADAATLYSCVGFLALVLGMLTSADTSVSGRHRGIRPDMRLIWPGLVLVLAHLATPQRAARLGVYVTLLILLVLLVTATGRARSKVNALQAGSAASALVALGLFVVLASAAAANSLNGSPDVVSEATSKHGIGFTTRQGSIDSRFNQWEVAKQIILDQPVFGEGLGGEFIHYDEGSKSFVESDISHNIALDLLRRTGAVGLLLFVAACWTLFGAALLLWRRHPDDAVAALAAAAAAAALGILAKGMVESVFEKYRLAAELGVLLGIVVSCVRSYDVPESRPPLDPAPDLADPFDSVDDLDAAGGPHEGRIGVGQALPDQRASGPA